MTLLETIKNKIAEEFESIDTYLIKHEDVAIAIIKEIAEDIGKIYINLGGEQKLEAATTLFLQKATVPLAIAIVASDEVVPAAQNFIQKKYDELFPTNPTVQEVTPSTPAV